MSNVKYKIEDNFDYILEEGNKSYIALREIGWNGRDPKVDIRKWFTDDNNGEDKVGRGIGLTKEGANELAVALAKENFGSTKRLIRAIKNRDNFKNDLKLALESDEDPDDEDENIDDSELHDAAEILI